MGSAHQHHTGHEPQDGHRQRPAASRSARLLTLALLIPAVVATAIGMLLLWPHDPPAAPAAGDAVRALGNVVAVSPVTCPEADKVEPGSPEGGEPGLPEEAEPGAPGAELPPGVPPAVCGTVTVKLTEGPGAGTQIETSIPAGPGAIEVVAGDEVVLLYLLDGPEGSQSYSITDHQRSTELWLLAAAFALAVIAFGRWRGVTALAGLGLTFVVLLLFIVPAILDGRSPLLVAIVGAAAIMLTVLYLTHGFTMTTTIAVAGTLASLTITAALSALATAGTHLSGIADETSSFLNISNAELNMRGLLLAGIVIGSLGVLDDVTVTQSATVSELARANPGYGFRQLYSAATRIGRAHIASVINTIVLAYAGASLPLMLLFAAGSTPASELLTGQLIAQELVRSAVGTIGLIAAVPVTTALAAALAARHGPVNQPAPEPSAQLAPGSPDQSTLQLPAPAGSTATAGTQPSGPAPVGSPEQGGPPPADPWAAFVERHPDGRR